jgi:Fe-S cluster biogenesis protein NfuA
VSIIILCELNQEVTHLKEKVQATLEKIRPSLQADGGDVELVDVENGVVKVRLTGACGTCPMSTMTLRLGVERMLKKEVPEMTKLVAL